MSETLTPRINFYLFSVLRCHHKFHILQSCLTLGMGVLSYGLECNVETDARLGTRKGYEFLRWGLRAEMGVWEHEAPGALECKAQSGTLQTGDADH